MSETDECLKRLAPDEVKCKAEGCRCPYWHTNTCNKCGHAYAYAEELDTLQRENAHSIDRIRALRARCDGLVDEKAALQRENARLKAPLTVPEFCEYHKWEPDEYYDYAELFNAVIARRVEGTP
jgi:hypothetical protein